MIWRVTGSQVWRSYTLRDLILGCLTDCCCRTQKWTPIKAGLLNSGLQANRCSSRHDLGTAITSTGEWIQQKGVLHLSTRRRLYMQITLPAELSRLQALSSTRLRRNEGDAEHWTHKRKGTTPPFHGILAQRCQNEVWLRDHDQLLRALRLREANTTAVLVV